MENNSPRKTDQDESFKKTISSIAVYTSTSIFGPLVLFGLAGWWADKVFQTKPWFLLGGILIAFIFTNILIWREASVISQKLKEFGKKNGEEHKSNGYDEEDDDKWPNEKIK